MAITLPVGSLLFVDTSTTSTPTWQKISEHNREPLSFSSNRIEQLQRMSDGTLRKFFVADKKILGVAWQMLPSRSTMTVDGGWGAVDIQDYYYSAKGQGTFKIKIVYGEQVVNGTKSERSEIMEVIFSSCAFDVVKRNVKEKTTDAAQEFWNVNLSMEQV
jgi:hypothetical protein